MQLVSNAFFFFLSDENNLFLQCYSAVSALFSAGYGTTTLLVTLGSIKAYLRVFEVKKKIVELFAEEDGSSSSHRGEVPLLL